MFLQPLARKGGGALQPVSRGYSTPAPVGGWNQRDSIADMPEADAYVLKNWFPVQGRVRVRRGFEEHASGLGDYVESLLTYANGTTEKMFGCADGNIFDVTSSGAVGAAVVAGMSNDRWQSANMGTSGGNFLIAVNGEDTPRKYDGSSWGTTSISGVTPADLIDICVFKRRLLFAIKETLKFAYLDVEAIAGTASTFDLAPICSLGGYLMSIGTWTRDGGDGLDDLAVFYTSKGQVAVYQGTDPDSASTWSLVGVFNIGAPVGRRSMMRAGPDLILISQDGFVPLSKALISGRTISQVAISDKIRNAVNDAVRNYGTNFGWEAVLYPRGSMALFNVPLIENGKMEQYVVNTSTGAWAQFTGLNANCWAVLNEKLYFGGNGKVYLADSGFDDDGSNIETDVQQAATYLGNRGRLKAVRMLRPALTTDGALNVAMTVNMDFNNDNPISAPTFTTPQGAVWDVAVWNDAEWAVGATIAKDWASVNGIGYAASIRMRLASNGFEVFWNATDWVYETGGLL